MVGNDDESRIDETRESIDQSIDEEKGRVVRACVLEGPNVVERRRCCRCTIPKRLYTEKDNGAVTKIISKKHTKGSTPTSLKT
jgi:hypothetical protein